MTETARKVLEEAAKARTTDHIIEYAGNPVGNSERPFGGAQAAGLPFCTPHVLRHSAAVWMAEADISMAEIANTWGTPIAASRSASMLATVPNI